MAWEVEIITFLQRIGNSFCDYLFYFITQFGAELIFMLAVMALYWCVNKREGFRLVNLFMISQIVVGFIKVMVKRTRPYYLPEVKPILEETGGYSFPSGHSNNIAVIGTDISLMAKSKNGRAFKAVLIATCVMIPFVMLSRLYLGQHYLTDVITGAIIGTAVALIGFVLFDKILGDNEDKLIYIIVPGCVILLVLALVFFAVKGEEFDSLVNIAGTYSAAAIGYYIEKHHIKYEVKSDKLWRYFVRFIVGVVIVLVLKEGLKALFNLFAQGIWSLLLTGFIRYFIIGIFVTLFAPMIFKKLKI